MTADTSRRSLLAGLSVAPITLGPAAAAVSFAGAGSQELHALWNKRRALRPVLLENAAQCAAATAALPWWAKPGPSRLFSDGTISGPISNWPAIRDLKPPTIEGAFRLLRPSAAVLKDEYEAATRFSGRDTPARRASYSAALQRFEARKREQRAEEAKAGLTALEKQRDALFDDLFAISKAIEALPDRTPDAVAASLLMEFNLEATTRDNTGCNIQGIAGALRIMLPCLTGNIAADAADLLDNPDSPVADRMAWIS
jgi:hypothetical protein